MRTGNVLFKASILEGDSAPFNPDCGRTGGEDADFFSRMLSERRTFVWANDARVYEEVPPERQRRRYHVRRAFIRGVTSVDDAPLASMDTLKSVAAVAVYSVCLPFFFMCGQHLFMRYLVRNCDHLAKLLARFGFTLVRERNF
jgi:hypothetical protein